MSRVRDLADNNVVFVDGITTADITEHTNLFFTDARADARLALKMVDEDNMSSNSAAHMPTQQSVKAYVDTEVASLVDSSPGTLDTLNELAAALGDDPNFATTVSTNIGTKVSKSGDVITTTGTNNQAPLQLSSASGLRHQFATDAQDDAYYYMYDSAGANTVAFRTDGNPSFIAGGGNVGIGTTSPQSELHIEKAISGDQSQLRISNGAGATMRMGITGSGTNEHAHIKTNSAENLEFHIGQAANSTSPNVVFKSGGNVGIGTASPSAKLEVDDGGAVGQIRLTRSGSTRVELSTNANEGELSLYRSSNAKNVYISSYYDSYFNGGNVGIGTTSPETRLDVRSATATYLTVGNTTDNTSGLDTGIIFKQIGNIGNPATIQVIGNLSPTSSSAYTAGFKFQTGDWNGSAFSTVDAMTIAASGNVGIGTTSPSAILQITPPNEEQNSFRIYRGGSSGYELNYLNMSLYQGNTVFNTTSTDSSGKRYIWQINGAEAARIEQDGSLNLLKTRAGAISSGTSNTGAVIKLHTEGQWEGGYGNDPAASTNDYLGSIEFSTGDGSTGEGVRAAIRGTVDSYYNQNSIVFETCDHGDTTLDERMRVLHNGNVGIGTANPVAPLDFGVTSTNQQVLLLRQNGASRTGFSISNDYGVRAFGPSDATSTGSLFGVGEMSSGTNYLGDLFTVRYDGRVGIGTTTPSEKLHVAGVIRSEGYDTNSITSYNITGSYTAGTEYVFTTRSQLNGLGYGAGFYKFLVWSDTFHAGTSHYQCYTPYDEFYHNNYGSNTSTVQTINYGVSMGHAPNTGTRAIDIRLRHKYGADATYPANQTFTFIPVNGFTNLNGNSGYHLRIYLFKVA